MSVVRPWHSVKSVTGNNIERENWRSGMAGRQLRLECRRLAPKPKLPRVRLASR